MLICHCPMIGWGFFFFFFGQILLGVEPPTTGWLRGHSEGEKCAVKDSARDARSPVVTTVMCHIESSARGSQRCARSLLCPLDTMCTRTLPQTTARCDRLLHTDTHLLQYTTPITISCCDGYCMWLLNVKVFPHSLLFP